MKKKTLPIAEQIKKLEDAIRKFGDYDGSRARKLEALKAKK